MVTLETAAGSDRSCCLERVCADSVFGGCWRCSEGSRAGGVHEGFLCVCVVRVGAGGALEAAAGSGALGLRETGCLRAVRVGCLEREELVCRGGLGSWSEVVVRVVAG